MSRVISRDTVERVKSAIARGVSSGVIARIEKVSQQYVCKTRRDMQQNEKAVT